MKRSLYCIAAVLISGLILLGCGQPETPATGTAPVASPAAPEMAMPAPVPAIERPAPAEPGAVLATVQDTDITEADVQKVLNSFMAQMGGQVPPDQLAEVLPRIRERILEELIMRHIMLAAVAREGVTLSDSEFAEIKAELADELPPGMSFDDYLTASGITESEIREQMTVRKMVISRADAVEPPTDEEVRAFYEENKEGFAQDASVTASHILLRLERTDGDDVKEAKRERLASIRQQLLEGADFAEMAREHSDCPSASGGGDLGPFGRGQMVSEFEDAAFSQPVGSVGQIVETQFGYHLIKVTEKTEPKTPEFEEVRERIQDLLYSQKQQEVVGEFVEGLRAGATVTRYDAVPSEDMLFQLDIEDDTLPLEAVVAIEEAAEEVEEAPGLLEKADEALTGITESVSEQIDAVEEAVAPVIAEVTEAASEILSEAAEAVEQGLSALTAAVPAMFADAEESVEESVEDVADAVESAPVPEEVETIEAETEVPVAEIEAEIEAEIDAAVEGVEDAAAEAEEAIDAAVESIEAEVEERIED